MSREVGGEAERGMKIDEHNFAVAHDVGMVSAMGAFGPWALWAVGPGSFWEISISKLDTSLV